jgi:hypothetical protein
MTMGDDCTEEPFLLETEFMLFEEDYDLDPL